MVGWVGKGWGDETGKNEDGWRDVDEGEGWKQTGEM